MEKVNHSETHCPSCGKFTGTYERCPYCGAEVQKRLSIRFFKYGSVLLAVIGVLFIYLASTKKNIEVTDLSTITETMNFAFVKLRGTVEGNPRIYRNDRNQVSGLNFTLLTGTTEVRVRAYSGVARDLVNQHKVPLAGEELTLMGSLRLKNAGNDIDIYLQAPEHLLVEPKPPVERPFWELTPNDKGRQAHISAVIEKINRSETSAPNTIQIVSESGKSGEMVIWGNTFKALVQSAGNALRPGTVFKANVRVNEYRGNVQLVLENAGDIEFTGEKRQVKKEHDILSGEVKTEDIGLAYKVTGTILEKFTFSQLNKYVLKYHSGEIDFVIFRDALEQVSHIPEPGDKVSFIGKVDTYKGKLQFILDEPVSLELLDSTPITAKKERKVSELRSTGEEVSEKDKGKIMVLEGRVFNRENSPKFVKYRLIYDNDKEITLFMFSNVVQYKKEIGQMSDGTRIRVKGKIDVYKGELEIIVNHSDNIEILEGK